MDSLSLFIALLAAWWAIDRIVYWRRCRRIKWLQRYEPELQRVARMLDAEIERKQSMLPDDPAQRAVRAAKGSRILDLGQ